MTEQRAELKSCPFCTDNEKLRAGDGWKAFEKAKVELGRIIGDDYEGRSMWPRLHRTKMWWDKMQRERDEARAQLSRMRKALFPKPVQTAKGRWVDSSADKNLYAAIIDLEMRGADAVCIKTLKEVLRKLHEARVALSDTKDVS